MCERAIFEEALHHSDLGQRLAYLDQACAGDDVLRTRIEVLLASHSMASEYLKVPDVREMHAPMTVTHRPDSAKDGGVETTSEDDASLAFLGPTTRSDSLGRIGHYEVLQILGKGGFGIVYRAFDDVLHRVVAVKVLSPQMAVTSPARKRFLHEARSSAAVRHENVVQVYEVGETPLPFIVMEFIPGETLQQRLNRVGPVDVSEVLRIGKQIAEGLAAAHATDLIHRDIKPANVMIKGGQKAKITDFGLARAADDATMTQTGQVAGTPLYMAPEQANGEKLDHRADLFSLGSVLYQMVTGRPPFRAESTLAVLKRVAEDTPRPIREIIPEAPPWLCEIIPKLHEKKPDDRFQSARELADLLAHCEAQLQANAKVQSVSAFPSRTNSTARFGAWKWIAAVAVMFCVVAFVWNGPNRFGNRQPEVTSVPSVKPPEPQPTIADKPKVQASGGSALTEADIERIATLSPVAQYEEVRKELRRLNPEFKIYPGKFTANDNLVVEVFLPGRNITDLSSLRALRSLRKLTIANLKQTDLHQIVGLNLTHLDVSYGNNVIDLAPLAGMPLEELRMQNWEGTDLLPLRGMPLGVLNICGNGQHIDLKPLAGHRLEELYMNSTIVPDLVPIRGMPLKIFHCAHSNVSDLTPLAGMDLSEVNFNYSKVTELTPLKRMQLTGFSSTGTQIKSLAPLAGMPLTRLSCNECPVTDLSPIKGMPRNWIQCDFDPKRDTELLRGIRTLETINDLPAADFWKMVEAKEKK